MPDERSAFSIWTGRIMLALVSFFALTGMYLHWFEPFDRGILIVDGTVMGISAGLGSIYLLASLRTEWGRWSEAGSMNILGTFMVVSYAFWSRGWWFFWRVLDRPEWMREQQILPLTWLAIGLLMMFGAAVMDRNGRILPQSWVIAIACVVAGIIAAGATIGLLAA